MNLGRPRCIRLTVHALANNINNFVEVHHLNFLQLFAVADR